MQDTRFKKTFDISEINRALLLDKNGALELAEKNMAFEIEKTAESVFETNVKIVLVCGRSASGKTTFTKRLCEKLCEMGKEAKQICLDDFFLGIKHLPLNDDGTYDMESIKGLDTDLANECIKLLLARGEADFPAFDFVNQRRSERRSRVTAGEKSVIVIEGIHALAPALTENLPKDKIARVYIEPKQDYYLNGRKIFSAEEIRLMRRMTRDELFRGWSAEKTLLQWKSVRAGEKIYIEPHIASAEIRANTSFGPEPAVFKKILTEMLLKVKENSPFFQTAREFIENLAVFEEINPEILDKDSVLREFVG